MERSWDRFQIVIGQFGQDLARAFTQQRSAAGAPNSSALRGSVQGGETSKKQPHVNWVSLGVEVAIRFVVAIGSGYAFMYLSRKALESLNSPEDGTESEKKTYQRLSEILSRRKGVVTKPASSIPPLNQYERIMAQDVVLSDDITTCFADIGGLDDIKREIYQLAILPLIQPQLFQSKLVEPTKGILLYGKPGTGKTMLAKAIAKESHAVFLPLQLSKILSKWVGESNKLVAATFSLAHKLQPCILFVDELDTFLKANHDSTAYLDSIKAEFLTLWDGIVTNERSRVLVLGATNQPQNIDSAILRRLPRTFHIPLPDYAGRLDILERLVADEPLTKEAREYLPELARLTADYSGSDLKELCKAAAMVKIHEYTAEYSKAMVSGGTDAALARESAESESGLRPMMQHDWTQALQKVQRTGAAAQTYGQEDERNRQRSDVQALARLFRGLSALSPGDDNGEDDETIPDIKD